MWLGPLPVSCGGADVQHRYTTSVALDYLITNSIEKAPDAINTSSATCVCLYISCTPLCRHKLLTVATAENICHVVLYLVYVNEGCDM